MPGSSRSIGGPFTLSATNSVCTDQIAPVVRSAETTPFTSHPGELTPSVSGVTGWIMVATGTGSGSAGPMLSSEAVNQQLVFHSREPTGRR